MTFEHSSSSTVYLLLMHLKPGAGPKSASFLFQPVEVREAQIQDFRVLQYFLIVLREKFGSKH